MLNSHILLLLFLLLVIFDSLVHEVQGRPPTNDKNEKRDFPLWLSPWLQDGQLRREPPFYSPYIVNLDQSQGRKLLLTNSELGKENSVESSSLPDRDKVTGNSLLKTDLENGLQTSTESTENNMKNVSNIGGIQYPASPKNVLQRAQSYIISKDVKELTGKEFRSENGIMNIDETIRTPTLFQRILNQLLSNILVHDESKTELSHKSFEYGDEQIKEKVGDGNMNLSDTKINPTTQIIGNDGDKVDKYRDEPISSYGKSLSDRHTGSLRGGGANYFVRVIVEKRFITPEDNLHDGEYSDESFFNSQTIHPIPNLVSNTFKSKSKRDNVTDSNNNGSVNSWTEYSTDSNTSLDQAVHNIDSTLKSLNDSTIFATELPMDDDNSTTGSVMTSANVSEALMTRDDNGFISEGCEKTHVKSEINQVEVRDVKKGNIDENKSTTENGLYGVLKQENESTRDDLELFNINYRSLKSAAEEKADKFINFFRALFGNKII